MKDHLLLSADIGGTKVAAALITPEGSILRRLEEPTCQLGPQAGIEQVIRLLEAVLVQSQASRKQVLGVGIGIPAVLALETDLVIWAPNLQGWRDVALRPAVERAMDLPVYVEYDGHTAILGEWWLGAGRGYRSIAMAIVGTGIGGGLIMDGRLVRGHNRLAGAAGWFGMTSDANLVDDRGRSVGHWESLAAGPGIAQRAAARLPDFPDSLLNQPGNEKQLTARQVFEAARLGDALAAKVVRETADLIGLGAANMISLTDPEIFILGGSIGSQSDLLLEHVRQVVLRWAQPISARSVKITSAKLGPEAGLYGAACAVLERTDCLPPELGKEKHG